MRKDIDLNFSIHPLTGDLAMKTGKSAIEQSMRNLLLTSYYERGFNIEIGSDIHSSIFENFSIFMQQTIKNNIVNLLDNFEPNVEVVDVLVSLEESNELLIDIYYTYYNNPQVNNVTIPIARLR
jgi:hypothetical protein